MQKMEEIPPNMQGDGIIKVGTKLKKFAPIILLS